MSAVLLCLGLAGTHLDDTPPPVGLYLRDFDLNAHDGRGTAEWTPDVERALWFPTMDAALAAWRTPSPVRPLRDDGQPNRPLTAYTVTAVKVKVVAAPPEPRESER